MYFIYTLCVIKNTPSTIMNGNNTETKFILNSLEQIISLTNEDLPKNVLEIEANVDSLKNYDLLRRIHKSVSQYLEKKRELVYIGFMGHFSSGKSSTINSLLQLSGKDARDVDLHPSDKAISLITHPKNEPSFIKLVSYGNTPVKPVIVDHEFLENLVLIDTPGTGDTDPLLMNELMHDYLPICDIIFYFFSSTNPLDKNDLPLLNAKHENLPLIPTKFVITRGDEFRKDFDKGISIDNYNELEAEKFVIKAKARIEESIDLFKVNENDFFVIDNKKSYNLDLLLKFVEEFIAADNIQNKIKMHEYKVALFRKTGFKIRDNFANHAHSKLKTLNKYVAEANVNIAKYDDKVRITNNRLTETWRNYQDEIEKIRNKNIKDLEEAYIKNIPPKIWENPILLTLIRDINSSFGFFKKSSISEYTKKFIDKILQEIDPQFKAIEDRISKINLGSFEGIEYKLEDFKINSISDVNINFSASIERDLNKIQSELKNVTKDFIFSMKSNNNSLSYRLSKNLPLPQLTDIINKSHKGLNNDIDSHFEHVYLYRAGVFAEHVKEYIENIGIGNKLNQLEKEFNESFKESIKEEAKEIIFPNFENKQKNYLRKQMDLIGRYEENMTEFSSIDLSTVDFEKLDIHSRIKENSEDLKNTLLININRRINSIVTGIVKDIDDMTRSVQETYKQNTKQLRNKRLIRLSLFFIIPTILIIPFSIFDFLDLKPNVANSYLIGIAANIIIPLILYILGRATDKYPERIRKKKDDYKNDITTESSAIISKNKLIFKENQEEQIIIEKQFRETLDNQIADIKNQKFSEYIGKIYSNLHKMHMVDIKIRKNYIEEIKLISDEFKQYFTYDEEKLEQISNEIKKEAIEPSFKFLENLKKDISDVYEKMNQIELVQ